MTQRDQFNVKCGDLTPDFASQRDQFNVKCGDLTPDFASGDLTPDFASTKSTRLLKKADVYYLYPTCSLV